MAFKLSKFEIGMIAAFVVVTGAGIGGYIYTSGLVEAAKADLANANGELQKLVKQRYLPSESNIKTLEGNIATLQAAIKPIEEQILKSPENKLGQIQAQNPVTWKNSDLDQTVQRLTALSKARRVTLPADYYFGFSRYQKTNPSEQATLILGKQLYGIEQLATKLFESGDGGSIVALRSIRRTFDEDGAGAQNAGGGEGSEALRGTSLLGAGKLYRIYPFEVEFVGTTNGLRTYLNSLFKTPVLFVVRSLQVTNSKIESPKVGDLGKGSNEKAGRDFIFGGEQITVLMRVDMIEWLGTQGAEAAAAATAKPAQGAKR